MADLQRLQEALIAADRAGDVQAATMLAQAIRAAQQPAAPEPSMLDQLGRQAGLTVRHAVEGVASVPGMFIDPFQRLLGGRTMSEGVSSMLDRAGLPRAETDAEKLVGAVSRAMAGAGGSAAAARAIPQALAASPAVVNNVFAQAPGAQVAQAGIGAGASEAARQEGVGPTGQLIAGAVAPVAASGVSQMASMAARGANELRRPITRAGAEQIAADTLGRVTADKTTALANLDAYLARKAAEEAGGPIVGVPGSAPTAAAVAGDVGVVGASRMAERGSANPLFVQRYAENNAARLEDLARLRSTEDQLAQYVARRDQVSGALRETAFDNAKGPVDYQPVVDRILQQMSSPAGGRVESQKALDWLAGRIGKYVEEGRVDPRNAYALHQDIGNLVAGKINTEKGPLVLAAGLANDVKRVLGRQIDAAAPGFGKYLETYSRMSKPIDRLEVLVGKLGGENLSKVTNAEVLAGGAGGQYALSQAKMRNVVNGLDQALPVGRNGLPLAPYQEGVLGRVLGDLNAETFAKTGGKMPGSDTYQNMATANFLRGVLGDSLAEAGAPGWIKAPVSIAMRPLESRVNDIVTQALLDPAKFAELLKKARTQRASPSLWGAAQDVGTGASLGVLGSILARQ